MNFVNFEEIILFRNNSNTYNTSHSCIKNDFYSLDLFSYELNQNHLGL